MIFKLSWRDGAYRVNKPNICTDGESIEVIEFTQHNEAIRDHVLNAQRQEAAALLAAARLQGALDAFDDLNWGVARQEIHKALDALPFDYGEGTTPRIKWRAAEGL